MSTTLPLAEQHTPNDPFRQRLWMAGIWAWPVLGVTFGFFFIIVAGFLPPPQESASAAEIAAFYNDHRTAIRAGLIGAMFASALLLPFFTVVSAEMRKIEGRNPLLAPIQFGGAVILCAFFQIICLFWLLASFRRKQAPRSSASSTITAGWCGPCSSPPSHCSFCAWRWPDSWIPATIRFGPAGRPTSISGSP
jgi:hypothetical protein